MFKKTFGFCVTILLAVGTEILAARAGCGAVCNKSRSGAIVALKALFFINCLLNRIVEQECFVIDIMVLMKARDEHLVRRTKGKEKFKNKLIVRLSEARGYFLEFIVGLAKLVCKIGDGFARRKRNCVVLVGRLDGRAGTRRTSSLELLQDEIYPIDLPNLGMHVVPAPVLESTTADDLHALPSLTLFQICVTPGTPSRVTIVVVGNCCGVCVVSNRSWCWTRIDGSVLNVKGLMKTVHVENFNHSSVEVGPVDTVLVNG
jgi:hypothetical protein